MNHTEVSVQRNHSKRYAESLAKSQTCEAPTEDTGVTGDP